MNGSYLCTPSGLFVVTGAGKHYTIPSSHLYYGDIVDAVKAGHYDKVDKLFDAAKTITTKLWEQSQGAIRVDIKANCVWHRDKMLDPVHANRLIDMHTNGHDIGPYVYCLEKIMANPFPTAREYFSKFMEKGVTPINEVGNFILYKRVDNDYRSFFDSKTINTVGTELRMDPRAVDSNVNNTCSTGYHCCSHEYLPHYHGGQGRIMICELNPVDVVAFVLGPNDSVKIRATGYKIIGELGKPLQDLVEDNKPAIADTVVSTDEKFNDTKSTTYVEMYHRGYNDGRKRVNKNSLLHWSEDHKAGYEDGYKDGRGHKPRKYQAITSADNGVDAAKAKPWPYTV